MGDVWSILVQVVERVSGPFLSFGSMLSLTSLACALVIAVGFLAHQRRRRGRPVRLKVIRRAMFPRRMVCASSGIDFSYLIFNVFIFGAMFGWAVLSFHAISNGVSGALTAAFGAREAATLPELASRVLVTLVLFLAYELGYWVHHYLCHRVPFLWEFHKVHHTANMLTPMTVFRVHPVDTWLFVNVLAIAVATANGIASYALGAPAQQYTLTNTNLILVVFIHVYVHFQHSHLWIAMRGIAGRIFLSPAHHQVHHSTNPIHFNKNLGSCLAIWDWVFGTLHVPAKAPERLRFGVASEGRDEQTVTEAYLAPFSRAVARATTAAEAPEAAHAGAAMPASATNSDAVAVEAA